MPSGTTTLGNAVIGTASSFDKINVTDTANHGTATLSLNMLPTQWPSGVCSLSLIMIRPTLLPTHLPVWPRALL